MLNNIQKRIDRIQQTKYMLDEREDRLDRILHPIFKETHEWRYSVGFGNYRFEGEYLVADYYWRGEVDGSVKVPTKLLETVDPVQATKDWVKETKRQEAIQERRQKRASLLRELERLDDIIE